MSDDGALRHLPQTAGEMICRTISSSYLSIVTSPIIISSYCVLRDKFLSLWSGFVFG